MGWVTKQRTNTIKTDKGVGPTDENGPRLPI